MLRLQLEGMLWVLWVLGELVQRCMLALGVANDGASYYQQWMQRRCEQVRLVEMELGWFGRLRIVCVRRSGESSRLRHLLLRRVRRIKPFSIDVQM